MIHICCWYVFQGPVTETSYWGSWQHFDWSCWHTDIHTNTNDLTASLPDSTNVQQSLDRRLKLEPEVDKEADDHGQYQSDDCYTQLKQLVVFFVTKPAHQLYITIIFIIIWFPLPLLPLRLWLRAGKQDKHAIEQWNNTTKKIANIFKPGLCGDNPLAMVRLSQRCPSSQSLGK